MSKSFLFIFAIASTLSLGACGGKSGNGGIPKAPSIQDESEALFSDAEVLSPSDPKAQLVSPTDSSCQDKDGAGHQVVDHRLTPNSLFEKTVQVGVGGENNLREFSVLSTILTNETTSYSRRDDYKISDDPRTDQVTCDFKSKKGPWLNCLDQESTKITKSQFRDKTGNHCRVEWSKADKDNKTTYQVKTREIFGKQINETRVVTEHDGNLKCNNLAVGPGKSVEVHVYSFDVPSLIKDSCSPAEIYFFYKIADKAGNIYVNNSEKLTNYLLPTENPDDISNLTTSSPKFDGKAVVPPPPTVSNLPSKSVAPAMTLPEALPPATSINSDGLKEQHAL